MIYLTSVSFDTSSDAEIDGLIKKTGTGDKEAFSMLYEKTKSSVYGFALSLLKNSHDASDAMQNTYIKVWNASPYYKRMGKPMAWILTVTKNLCYEMLRTAKNTLPIDEYEDMISDEMSYEDKLFIEFCLKQLGDLERQILTLHAVSGFKHREIARLFDMPIGTVLSKYNRALKKIKQSFEGGESND